MSNAKTGETHQLAFRFTYAEVAWLKTEAERLSAETMLSVSVTDVVRRLVALAMRGSTTAPTVAAPALTHVAAPTVDPRQTTIPGALAPAKVAKLVVVKTPKTKGAPDHETIRLAYAAALEAGTIKPKDLAAELGFADASSLSHFKGGKRKLDAERLAKLAKRLGVA
jgi:hypothetical protein